MIAQIRVIDESNTHTHKKTSKIKTDITMKKFRKKKLLKKKELKLELRLGAFRGHNTFKPVSVFAIIIDHESISYLLHLRELRSR